MKEKLENSQIPVIFLIHITFRITCFLSIHVTYSRVSKEPSVKRKKMLFQATSKFLTQKRE